jgi:hypothetical protein
VNGFLFPPDDIAAQAARMRQLAANPGLRARIGAEARRLAARFDASVMIRALEQEVLDAISANGNPIMTEGPSPQVSIIIPPGMPPPSCHAPSRDHAPAHCRELRPRARRLDCRSGCRRCLCSRSAGPAHCRGRGRDAGCRGRSARAVRPRRK